MGPQAGYEPFPKILCQAVVQGWIEDRNRWLTVGIVTGLPQVGADVSIGGRIVTPSLRGLFLPHVGG